MNVELTLYSNNTAMLDAWSEAFAGGQWEADDVRIVEGTLTDLDRQDCVVMPGNSYGIIAGKWATLWETVLAGVPIEELQTLIQSTIADHYLGELPVGSAFTVNLNDTHPTQPKHLVYSSFFRVPTNRPVADANYLCLLSSFMQVNHRIQETQTPWKPFQVAVGDLGCTLSKQDPTVVACQMKAAWDQFCNLDRVMPESFSEVMERGLKQ